MMEHFTAKFGDASCIGFWDSVQKIRQTDRQTNRSKKPHPATAVGVGNKASVGYVGTMHHRIPVPSLSSNK